MDLHIIGGDEAAMRIENVIAHHASIVTGEDVTCKIIDAELPHTAGDDDDDDDDDRALACDGALACSVEVRLTINSGNIGRFSCTKLNNELGDYAFISNYYTVAANLFNREDGGSGIELGFGVFLPLSSHPEMVECSFDAMARNLKQIETDRVVFRSLQDILKEDLEHSELQDAKKYFSDMERLTNGVYSSITHAFNKRKNELRSEVVSTTSFADSPIADELTDILKSSHTTEEKHDAIKFMHRELNKHHHSERVTTQYMNTGNDHPSLVNAIEAGFSYIPNFKDQPVDRKRTFVGGLLNIVTKHEAMTTADTFTHISYSDSKINGTSVIELTDSLTDEQIESINTVDDIMRIRDICSI